MAMGKSLALAVLISLSVGDKILQTYTSQFHALKTFHRSTVGRHADLGRANGGTVCHSITLSQAIMSQASNVSHLTSLRQGMLS